MPYIVTNSDGSSVITVPDSAVDTGTYSLALIGRNVANYGQYFAQNTLRHLENFASTTAPSPGTLLQGQLWYNKSEQQLSVWQGATWKRIGTVVGSQNQKPTTYRSSGTSFFNTTTNKLEVWNNGWQEAGYGGLVTSAYSADSDVQSPITYGTRLRTLFLREAATDRSIPVLAMIYTKSPQISPGAAASNRGTTEVPVGSGNYETIMAFWSDYDFYVNSSGTETPIGDSVVNYYDELVEVDGSSNPLGILSARSGRNTGQVFKGLNQRAEYEGSSIATFDSVFITGSLGSESVRVPEAYFTELDVSTLMTVLNLNVDNDASVGSMLTVEGNITSTSGIINTTSLVVTNDTTLNGTTTINGSIVVNGVNTQTLGTDAERIEDGYFANIVVDTVEAANATIGNLTVTGTTAGLNVDGLQSSGDLVLTGGATIQVDSTIEGTVANVRTLSDTSSGTARYLTFAENDINNTKQPLRTDSGLTYEPLHGDLATQGNITASIFYGVATSAQYADLAEMYSSDEQYDAGTVVMIGGSAEVTACDSDACADVFGVVSTAPAVLMNDKAEGVPVALQGRVPVKVLGPVKKGERLVSAGNGKARGIGDTEYDARIVIGRSLCDHSADEGIVEAVIGVK